MHALRTGWGQRQRSSCSSYSLLFSAICSDPWTVFPSLGMLNFFGKLSSPMATSKSATEADAAAAGDILGRAEAKLQQLRTGRRPGLSAPERGNQTG